MKNQCPFCACPIVQTVTIAGHLGMYPITDKTFVICQNCAATGPQVTSVHTGQPVDPRLIEAAHKLWDTRK